MRVITQIYMSCKPQLRDDWIAGADGDYDPIDAKIQEDNIRGLVQGYHERRYRQTLEDAGLLDDLDFFELEVERMGLN